METSVETQGWSRSRRIWFSALAAVLAVIFGVGLFGWIGLFLGWFANGKDIIHRVHDVGGSGVGNGLFIAASLLVLAWRREDIALLQAIAATGIAFGIASAIASDLAFALFLPIIAVPVVVLLAVGRGWRPFVALGAGFSVPILTATVVGAVFWIAYALSMARYQRIGPPTDPHVEMHHWTSMAGMALAIVLLGLLASMRTRGWRVVGWLAGLGAAVYGLASVVFANFEGTGVPYPGGEGVTWGLLAIAGGVATIAATEWQARQAQA